MLVTAVSIILLIAIVLLITELVPVDITGLAIMAALIALGILTPKESLAGFGNPAPITVAMLFIVSKGLMRTGALDFLTNKLIHLTKGNERRLLLLSLFLVGGFSSFLNNTPVVVLFISIIMAVCCEYNLSPSKFLLPISFVSILAGTSTLIGTSTNILVSDLATQSGQQPIGMFELSILGMPTAMAGAVFLYYLSPRLLRSHKEPVCETRGNGKQKYISELLVQKGSPLIATDAQKELSRRFPDIELYDVIRQDRVLDPSQVDIELQVDDVLLIKASAQQLAQILGNKCAQLPHADGGQSTDPHDPKDVVVELLAPPNSDAVGRRVSDLLARLDSHIRVLGIKRHLIHYGQEKLRDIRLHVGDILLVQVPLDHLDQIRTAGDLMLLEGVHQTIVKRKKAPLAMGIFLLMVLATTVGFADILVASMLATLLMLVTGCLSLREAYRSIDGRVLILIIGTLALGVALAKTGAADMYANGFLAVFQGQSPHVILSAFILLTSVMSLFLSNNSTAVLLVPIALSTAAALGVDPRPFVVGICFGASACYATPLGYQTNLLVYGPGGYRFGDYLRLGIPLNIGVWVVASIFVPMIWPF